MVVEGVTVTVVPDNAPGFQVYEVAPVDVLVKDTVNGAQPDVTLGLKPAVTALAVRDNAASSMVNSMFFRDIGYMAIL